MLHSGHAPKLFFLFLQVNVGPSQKFVGEIRGVFNFWGRVPRAWALPPGWPHQKVNPATAPD